MSAPAKPKVIIFSDHLLYPSETFIHAQASALSEFEPVYAGSRRVKGLDLSRDQVHVINHGNFWGKCKEFEFKLLGRAPALIKQLGALNPALLHAHYGPNGLRALPIANCLSIPMVVTLHGSEVTITDLRHQRTPIGFRQYVANKQQLMGSVSLFLTISNFLRRKLLDQGFPEERVLVHYTGVDTNEFRPESTETDPMILFVGRLEESKGAVFLLQAFAEIQMHLPSVELVLIGDGALRQELESRANGTLRRYRFLGTRSSIEVREWMNRASVICVPSVKRRSGEEEGLGMVCLEAHAVAKPVVAFHSGGIPEVISHGETGFLVTEADHEALSESLLVLLRNPLLRERFGRTGRERVLRQFSLERQTRLLEGIYSNLLDKVPHRIKASYGAIPHSSVSSSVLSAGS